MKKQYSTPWEETLWTAYDYKKPAPSSKQSKMKKYAISATVGIAAATAFAQTPKIQANDIEKYHVAKPVEVVVTAKRPVAKKDAAPRKSEVPPYQDPAKAAKVTSTPG